MIRTKSGKRVIHLEYVPTNACGRFVTFPIKGTVVTREKPLRTNYEIWTLDGNARPPGDHPNDLEVTND